VDKARSSRGTVTLESRAHHATASQAANMNVHAAACPTSCSPSCPARPRPQDQALAACSSRQQLRQCTPPICGCLTHMALRRASPPAGGKSMVSRPPRVSGDFFPASSPLL
jgi:hypothetical protein